MDANTRLVNLRRLISERGGPAELARVLGYSNASFLVQMAGPNPMRAVTEKTARAFEKKLGLPEGWLDSAAPVAPAPDVPVSLDVIKLIGQVLQDENITLPSARYTDLVIFALTEKLATPEQVKRVVKLMGA